MHSDYPRELISLLLEYLFNRDDTPLDHGSYIGGLARSRGSFALFLHRDFYFEALHRAGIGSLLNFKWRPLNRPCLAASEESFDKGKEKKRKRMSPDDSTDLNNSYSRLIVSKFSHPKNLLENVAAQLITFFPFFLLFFARRINVTNWILSPFDLERKVLREKRSSKSLESVYFRHADEWSQETRREENVKKRWWMIEMVNVECLASSSTPVGEIKHLLYRLLLPVVYFKRLSCKR